VINGFVTGRQAQIKIILRISGYPDLEVGCVVDTGFEGALTLPLTVVTKLQFPCVARINANLANDDNFVTPVHVATVVWDGAEIEVPVLAMGRRPLVGTLLLSKYNLNIDFCDGGMVQIDSLAQLLE
jgi:clan AA aspartic protease